MNEKFDNVTAVCKANVYFGGKVVSHTLIMPDGAKKTLGLIFPGSYNFKTDLAETMEMVAGACRVKLAGQSEWKDYAAGTQFDIPARSSFDIAVENGIVEYICTFVK